MEKKKKYRFFGKDTVPSCSTCVYGKLSKDRTQILCQKRGITTPTFCCRKYEFSPLARMPQATHTLFEDDFSENDFNL